MSLPHYPKYKDSGIDWFKNIPEHWEVIRLKNILKKKITDGPHLTPTFTSDGVPFLSVDGIQNGELVFDSCRYISHEDHSEFRKKALPIKNDILMGKAASTGKIARVKVDFEFSIWSPLALIRVDQKSSVPEFVEYVLKSPMTQAEIDTLCTANTQKNISMDDIPKLTLFSPPISEQYLITGFLDHETTKIDALVAEQERLIDLLKEKRKAVISHAVTKGINPKVKLKDSGVEWLGNVPEHWEVLPLKRFFQLVVDTAPKDNDFELLSLYTDIGVRPRKDLEARGNRSTTTEGYFKVSRGDIVVNKLLAWMGAIGVSEYDGVTSPAYDILRAKQPLSPHYYDYLFRCGILFTEFKRYSRGIMDMRLRLYFEELGQFSIPFPKLEEQLNIVAELNEKLNQLDKLRDQAIKAIDLLKERRLALISAAVMGQIDVRNYQPKEAA